METLLRREHVAVVVLMLPAMAVMAALAFRVVDAAELVRSARNPFCWLYAIGYWYFWRRASREQRRIPSR